MVRMRPDFIWVPTHLPTAQSHVLASKCRPVDLSGTAWSNGQSRKIFGFDLAPYVKACAPCLDLPARTSEELGWFL